MIANEHLNLTNNNSARSPGGFNNTSMHSSAPMSGFRAIVGVTALKKEPLDD